MAWHGKRRAGVVHAATWLVLLCAPARVAAQPEAALERVRTESQAIRDAIAWGLQESATFASLHRAIDSTDGLVYIDEGACKQVGMRACLYLTMHVTDRFRMLRIAVSPRRAPGCELTASIGHELQHVLEVLANPRVRQSTDMYFLFQRIGREQFGAFETRAAIDAGKAVNREACALDVLQASRWARTSGSVNRQITLSMK